MGATVKTLFYTVSRTPFLYDCQVPPTSLGNNSRIYHAVWSDKIISLIWTFPDKKTIKWEATEVNQEEVWRFCHTEKGDEQTGWWGAAHTLGMKFTCRSQHVFPRRDMTDNLLRNSIRWAYHSLINPLPTLAFYICQIYNVNNIYHICMYIKSYVCMYIYVYI